jgi:carbon monoxide dehydrogenase subunit G
MDLTGEERIAASRDRVWKALNDPEILRACIPGCESLEKISDTELEATVGVKIGPVKARFNGKVELTNLNPPSSYTISGEGKGGIAGFAKGGADVTLTQDGAETVLAYVVNADVGGKIAQLGSRLIASTSKKLATQFFENLNQAISGS